MTEDASGDDLTADGLGYAAALAELEQILDEIEADSVDVDVLAARVKRAAALYRLCRDRITAARLEIEHIVADLEPDDVAPPAGS
jgi:exodeoxyribonuclease VII small subunit